MDLFESNKQAFQSRYPDVWSVLEAAAPSAPPLVRDGDLVTNVDLGGTTLYPAPAQEWSRAQMDAFLSDPDRIRLPDPADGILSDAAACLRPDLEAFEAGEMAGEPVADVGYAFVYGIGLGYHLPLLVETCAARTYLLAEPVAEFVWLSLFAVDWSALFRACDESGAAIRFLVGKSPERTMLEIEALLIRDPGKAFLDGSWALLHYPSWDLRQARLLLNERIANFFVNPSYFEDEALMLENAFGNLVDRSFHLVDGLEHKAIETPVFVVGSGPSLDNDLEHIVRLRDKVVVITCGSALGILLKNGIRPDFHIENENTPNLVVNLEGFRDQHGLDGIRFVAASTVRPEAAGMFDVRWFYSRALLSPEAIFPTGGEPLPYTGPVVANAAASVMTALGFRSVYLFGVDCGRRPDAGHHARDAVYYDEGYDNFATDKGDSAEALETDFSRRVPGNFGGEIETSTFLDLSRRTMTELQRLRGVAFINCSDGARIEGARPQAAASLVLKGQEAEVARVLDDLDRIQPYFPQGIFGEDADFEAVVAACDVIAAGVAGLVKKSEAGDHGFLDFEHRLESFLAAVPAGGEGVKRMVAGSLRSLSRFAAYRGRRIADAGLREAYFRLFLERFGVHGGAVVDQARHLLRDFDRRLSCPKEPAR